MQRESLVPTRGALGWGGRGGSWGDRDFRYGSIFVRHIDCSKSSSAVCSLSYLLLLTGYPNARSVCIVCADCASHLSHCHACPH